MSLTSGIVLADRYRLLNLIATGGMGQVWRAEDTILGRTVALKILKQELSTDAQFVQRFRAEARHSAKINHPGVAHVFDYGEVADPNTNAKVSYLVMELVAGEPLSDVLERDSTLPLTRCLDMLEQSGRALNAAHMAGVIHRDVKPGNILITPTGQVKITDFGIAKTLSEAPITQTGMIFGTAQYLSPEQAAGADVTAASDVYSLAVVGYECLTGRRMFSADSAVAIALKHVNEQPPALPDSIPAPVRELFAHSLSKDPTHRYRDGGDFASAIAEIRGGNRPHRPAGIADTRPSETTRILSAAIPSGSNATRSQRAMPTAQQTPRRAGAPPTPAKNAMGGGAIALIVIFVAVLAAAVVLATYMLGNRSNDPVNRPSPTTIVPPGSSLDTFDIAPPIKPSSPDQTSREIQPPSPTKTSSQPGGTQPNTQPGGTQPSGDKETSNTVTTSPRSLGDEIDSFLGDITGQQGPQQQNRGAQVSGNGAQQENQDSGQATDGTRGDAP